MDANEFLMGGGAKAAQFPTIGTEVGGFINGEPKVQQQTDPKDNSPKFFPSGDPMRVLIVPIQTDLRDGPDDDGARALWIGGKSLATLRETIRATGAKGLEQGAYVSQKYVADGEKKQGLNPAKLYAFTYRRPTPGAAANAHLMSDEATQPPAAVPPASVPGNLPRAGYATPEVYTVPPCPSGIDPDKWQAMSPDQRRAVQAALGQPAMAGAAQPGY
jgi:hypothetical protein